MGQRSESKMLRKKCIRFINWLGIFLVCTFPKIFEMELVSGANLILFLHPVVSAPPTIHHGFFGYEKLRYLVTMVSHDVTVIRAVAGCHSALE